MIPAIRIVGAILCAAVALIILSSSASAHVLVTDATKTSGAILHIMPDDDPIAGEVADIYFDRQGEASGETPDVSLSIKDSEGETIRVKTTTKNALTTARYVFPQQGVYTLVFRVGEGERALVYEQSQRVTRGVTLGATQAETHAWAEALLIFCVVSFLALVVIIVNRHQEIKKYSTF